MPYRTDIPGWMTVAELQVIETLAAAVPEDGLVIEVGSFLGRSTWAWCNSVHPSASVIAIDIFDYLPEYGAWGMSGEPYDSSIGQEALFDQYMTDCENLTKIKSPSIAVKFPREHADLIFIDAAHQLPAVAFDLGYFYPVVKPGGVLAGHDYSPGHPDVIKSVDTLAYYLDRQIEIAAEAIWQIRM